jgi:hypothetical protein
MNTKFGIHMSPREFSLIILLLVFSLLLVSCGGSEAEIPSEESVEELGVDEILSATGSGLCANQYLPVVEGATWSYIGSDESLGSYAFTSTLKDVHDEGFTYFNDFDQLTQQQMWGCTSEGLLALEYNSGPAATVAIAGQENNYESSDISGISLPPRISTGDTWEQAFTLRGERTMPTGEIVKNSAVTSFSFEALGEEEISVEAGDFTALKVRTDVIFDLEVTINDIVVPTTLLTESVVWWVEGIGWVYSEDRAEINGIVTLSSIELQSYSIP